MTALLCAGCRKHFHSEAGLLRHAAAKGHWPSVHPTARRLAEAQNWRCAYCSCEMTFFLFDGKQSHATIDHYIPKSQGGKNTIDNYIAACAHCNVRRGSMDAISFWLMKTGRQAVPLLLAKRFR